MSPTDENAEIFTTRGKVERFNPRRDAEYVIGKAQNGETCVVAQGALVYFSTGTGDAWMLDVEDRLTLCLARSGERQPFRILQTDKTYSIEWSAHYRIDNEIFIVLERSGGVRSILGYPVDAIRKTMECSEGGAFSGE